MAAGADSRSAGQRALVGEAQGPFPPGEDPGELSPEPVHGAGELGDEIHPAAG